MREIPWIAIIVGSIVCFSLGCLSAISARGADSKPHFNLEGPRRCSGVFKKDATSPNIFLVAKPRLVREVVMRWTQLILDQMDEFHIENRNLVRDGYDPLVVRAGYRAAAFTSYEASEREVLFLIIPFTTSRSKVQVTIHRVPNGVILQTDGVDLSTEKQLLEIVQGVKL
jgi:hypothetical protein